MEDEEDDLYGAGQFQNGDNGALHSEAATNGHDVVMKQEEGDIEEEDEEEDDSESV